MSSLKLVRQIELLLLTHKSKISNTSPRWMRWFWFYFCRKREEFCCCYTITVPGKYFEDPPTFYFTFLHCVVKLLFLDQFVKTTRSLAVFLQRPKLVWSDFLPGTIRTRVKIEVRNSNINKYCQDIEKFVVGSLFGLTILNIQNTRICSYETWSSMELKTFPINKGFMVFTDGL